MVSLLPLILSVGVTGSRVPLVAGSIPVRPDLECRYCGAPTGRVPADLADDIAAACALCALARHLERARINDEARLIWLPEMSQAALNVMMRRIHSGLRSLGERPETGAQPSPAGGDRPLLYHGQQALLERTREAEVRLGTSDPAELADAMVRLSPAAFGRRDALLGAVRLLPLGRLFEGGKDVYPEIVDSWRPGGSALPKDQATVAGRPGGNG